MEEEGQSGGSNGGYEVGGVKVEDVGCHREQEVAVRVGDHLVQTVMKVAFHNLLVSGILAQIRGAGFVCRVPNHERQHQQAVAGTMNCCHPHRNSNRYHDFVDQGIDSRSYQLNSGCMTDAGHGILDCMSGTALAGPVQCTVVVVAVVDSLLPVDSNLDAHMCAVQDKHVHVAVP